MSGYAGRKSHAVMISAEFIAPLVEKHSSTGLKFQSYAFFVVLGEEQRLDYL